MQDSLLTNELRLSQTECMKSENKVKFDRRGTKTNFDDKKTQNVDYTALVTSSDSLCIDIMQPDPTVERQQTGRFLAGGVVLIMLFILLYHALLRQTPMLAGLIACAIAMILYLLWALHFKKKKKKQASAVVVESNSTTSNSNQVA